MSPVGRQQIVLCEKRLTSRRKSQVNYESQITKVTVELRLHEAASLYCGGI